MNNKQRKEMEEVNDYQTEQAEIDSGSVAQDINTINQKMYPGDNMPNGFYEFQNNMINPNSQVDFRGQLDRDWVLSNLAGKKPSLQQLVFTQGTLSIVESVFVVDRVIPVTDSNGDPVPGPDGKPLCIQGKMFDETFEPVRKLLLSDIKAQLVGARALGGDRESVLQRQVGIRKTFEKKKSDESNQMFGMGRR